ncbi:MAG: hypothetical protein ACE3L7_19625 [Candidatus Pristimantibacillus sp.]
MNENHHFKAGQELKTDYDFRIAKSTKVPIKVYQDRMLLRPPAPVIAYHDDIVKIADGTTFLRSVSKFYTLNADENDH